MFMSVFLTYQQIKEPCRSIRLRAFGLATAFEWGGEGSLTYTNKHTHTQFGHNNEFPARLTVRITAYDVRTGKMALIYQVAN